MINSIFRYFSKCAGQLFRLSTRGDCACDVFKEARRSGPASLSFSSFFSRVVLTVLLSFVAVITLAVGVLTVGGQTQTQTSAVAVSFSPADGEFVNTRTPIITLTFGEKVYSDDAGTIKFTEATLKRIISIHETNAGGEKKTSYGVSIVNDTTVTITPPAALRSTDGTVYIAVLDEYWSGGGGKHGSGGSATFTIDTVGASVVIHPVSGGYVNAVEDDSDVTIMASTPNDWNSASMEFSATDGTDTIIKRTSARQGFQKLSDVTNALALVGNSDGDFFGTSVALGDGLLVVGARRGNTDGVANSGAVYLITDSDSDGFFDDATRDDVTKIDLSAAGITLTAYDYFGASVALKDGLLVIGAEGDGVGDNNRGAVYLIAAGDDRWGSIDPGDVTKISNDTTGITLAFDGRFGHSVALENGLLAVGAFNDDTGGESRGAVYLIAAGDDRWGSIDPGDVTKISNDTTGITLVNNDNFGVSVALENGLLAVGASNDGTGGESRGAVYLIDADGDRWGSIVPDDVTKISNDTNDITLVNNGNFGVSVALENGLLAVGAANDDTDTTRRGAVYLIDDGGDRWDSITSGDVTEFTTTSTGITLALSADNFGISVALKNGLLVVGASKDDAVYVAPFFTATLGTDDFDKEGVNVADKLSEGTITVSAKATDAAGNIGSRGSRTFVYDITAPTISSASYVGTSVTVSMSEPVYGIAEADDFSISVIPSDGGDEKTYTPTRLTGLSAGSGTADDEFILSTSAMIAGGSTITLLYTVDGTKTIKDRAGGTLASVLSGSPVAVTMSSIRLNLAASDDTGLSPTDDITKFSGDRVSFTANLSDGTFSAGDVIRVYRDNSQTVLLSKTVSATEANTNSISLVIQKNLFTEGQFDLAATYQPVGGSERNRGAALTITYDTTVPMLREVTAVRSPTGDNTPPYTFSSDEAGTATYGGDCGSSSSLSAGVGVQDNTVIFNTLSDGTYSNCVIRVADTAGNEAVLRVSSFTVDTVVPEITAIYDGTTIIVTASEKVYGNPEPSDFHVVVNDGTAVSPSTITGLASTAATADRSFTLIMSDALSSTDSVTMYYTRNSATTKRITDTARNELRAIIAASDAITVNQAGVLLDLHERDDTGLSPTDDITKFSGDDVSFIATFPADTYSAGDTIKVYRGTDTLIEELTIDAGSAGESSVDFTILKRLFNNLNVINLSATHTPIGGTEGNRGTTLSIIYDTSAPTLTQVTAVPTPTNDKTPSYIFRSTEEGRIAFDGSCGAGSPTVALGAADTRITYTNRLVSGTYSNCTVAVTDTAGNVSNTLALNTFTVDLSVPTISSASFNGRSITLLMSEPVYTGGTVSPSDFTVLINNVVTSVSLVAIEDTPGSALDIITLTMPATIPTGTPVALRYTQGTDINSIVDTAGNALETISSNLSVSEVNVLLDLDERDDTGLSPTDDITKFSGDRVSFTVRLTSGSFATRDKVKIYRGSGNTDVVHTETVSSSENGDRVITLSIPKSVFSEGVFTLAAAHVDAGTERDKSPVISITYDTTAPVIAESTAITTPTSDTTPEYIFSSDEEGTVTYAGGCSSTITDASSGSNTISFTTPSENILSEGTYGSCTVVVADFAGNASNTLSVTPFVVDITAPTISSAAYSRSIITVILNEAVYSVGGVPAGDFTLTGVGSAAIRSVSVSNSKATASNVITITMNENIDTGTGAVTLRYAKNVDENNQIQDRAGNVMADASGVSVSGDPVITLDLAASDDTGVSSADDNTAFFGSQVSFTANLSDGTFSADDVIRVYRDNSQTVLLLKTVSATEANTNSISLVIQKNLFTEGQFDLAATYQPVGGSERNRGAALTITYDTTVPMLGEVTAVRSPTGDNTPPYTFSSDEAGTATYGGDCGSSSSLSAGVGVQDNTVIFNTLSDGTYSNCVIRVADTAGNEAVLRVSSFTVDTVVPEITAIYDGTTIIVTASEKVYGNPEPSDFHVVVNDGTAVSPSTITGLASTAATADRSFTLIMSDALSSTDSVTMYYTRNSATTKRITDTARNELRAIIAASDAITVNQAGVLLDLHERDDTGLSPTDDITKFSGDDVSFIATFPADTYSAGDTIKVYRGTDTLIEELTIDAGSAGESSVDFTILKRLFNNLNVINLSATHTPIGGTEGNRGTTLSIIYDTSAPTLTQVTAVPTPTNDKTPSYIFRSTEEGRIAFDGSCGAGSPTVALGAADTRITYTNRLVSGTYSNCTVAVTDTAGNVSNTLALNTFTVDLSVPTISSASFNGRSITLLMSEPVYTGGTVSPSDFTVLINNVVTSVSLVAIEDTPGSALDIITLTMPATIPTGTPVALRYTQGTDINSIVDTAGNALETISSNLSVSEVNVLLDLDERDDTGLSPTDDITKFSGDRVSFTVRLTSGSFATRDKVKIYRGSGNTDVVHTETVSSSENGDRVITLSIPKSVFSEGVFTLAAAHVDAGTERDKSPVISITYDTTAPVIAESTAITTPTSDTTPEYIFSSDEEGTVTYAGGCSSTITDASSGSNTISFTTPSENILSEGTYGSCTVVVADFAGNASNTLSVTPFVVDITAPTISSAIYSGDSVILTMNEKVYSTTEDTVLISSFSLSGVGDRTISSVEVASEKASASRTVTLNMDSAIPAGATITLSYTQDSVSANRIFDEAGNSLGSARDVVVAEIPLVTLDLAQQDDTGKSATDDITRFVGTDVTFTAMLPDGTFTTGDRIGIFVDSNVAAVHTEDITAAFGNGQSSITFTIPKSRFTEGAFDLAVSHTTAGGRVSPLGDALSIVYDVTRPILDEVTAVDTPTNDVTPKYSFSSSEVGAVTYDGDCTSTVNSIDAVDAVDAGFEKDIYLGTLSAGEYSNCTIFVTDDAGNVSLPLLMSLFVVDTTLPTISSAAYSRSIITVILNEAVYSDGGVPAGDFTLTGAGGVAIPIRSVSVPNSKATASNVITIIMNENIDTGTGAVTLRYTKSADENNQIQDRAGNVMANASDVPVSGDPVITLDLDAGDDTGDSNSDEKTSFIGSDVTFTATLSTGSLSTGDVIRVYRGGSQTVLLSKTVSATEANTNSISLVIPKNLFTEGRFDLAATYQPVGGLQGNKGAALSITYDNTAPTLREVTAVPSPTNKKDPSYIFSSNEAGSVSYSGACGAGGLTRAENSSNNMTTYPKLTDGTYSNCTVAVTDSAGNRSRALALNSFVIDTRYPIVTDASYDNTTITVVLSESVYSGGIPSGADFTVFVNGLGRTVTAVSVPSTSTTAASTIRLTTDTAITAGSTVTLRYAQISTGANRIIDRAGNFLQTMASSIPVSGASLITLDLSAVDDTGESSTDSITSFVGNSVTFTAQLNSGTFSTGDRVKLYLDDGVASIHTETVTAVENGSSTITFTVLKSLFTEDSFILKATHTPAGGSEGDKSSGLAITYDTVAPVLSEVTAVTSPTNDPTPNYVFSSGEAGSVSYGGDCSSSTGSVTSSREITITFAELSEGRYGNCSVAVTDTAGNRSLDLSVTPFVVDTTDPTVDFAVYDNSRITIVFNEAVWSGGNPAVSDFTLGVGSATITRVDIPSSSTTASNRVVLLLSNPVTLGSVVTLRYRQSDTEANRIKDRAGNALDTISSDIAVSGTSFIILDLDASDDTGKSNTDDITEFVGNEVSFSASINTGTFSTGDIVKVYLNNGSTPLYTQNITASSGHGLSSVNFTIPRTRFSEGMFTLRATYTPDGVAEGAKGTGLDVTYDTVAPVLSQVTAVTSPTNNPTPDYTFSSNEIGAIIYSGGCSSSVTSVTDSGSTIITFASLQDGTYGDCALTVTDMAGNESAALSVSSFIVDTVSPTVTSASYGGDRITLIFDEPVRAIGTVTPADFTLDGVNTLRVAAVNITSTLSDTVILTTNIPVPTGSAVTLTYDQGSVKVSDAANNDLESIDTALSVSGASLVTLDLVVADDTGSSDTDNITRFVGDQVSIVATLSTGLYRTGDRVKVYRDGGAIPIYERVITAVSGNGQSVITLDLPKDLFTESSFDLTATHVPLGLIEGSKGSVLSIIYDLTAPVIAPVSSVPTPTNDDTPSHSFSSNEIGTATYDGSCGIGSVGEVINSVNIVTYTSLSEGIHNDCTIVVADVAGNAFTFSVPRFVLDFTAPTINSARYSGSTITLQMSEDVHTAGTVVPADFTLTGVGSAVIDSVDVASSLALASDQITLTMSEYIFPSSSITLSYTQNSNAMDRIVDSAGNVLGSTSRAVAIVSASVITLNLVAADDTGVSNRDNITAFSGSTASFTVRLNDGVFNYGDLVKVYRGQTLDPVHILAIPFVQSGSSSVSFTIPVSQFVEGTFDLRAAYVSGGRESEKGDVLSITYDATDPTLVAVTVVPSMTNDVTPDYTFSSSEAGTVTYDGSCDSSVSSAVRGSTTITFDELAPGTYSNCSLILTDAAGNVSAPLLIAPFTISTDAPTVTAATYDGNTITLILSKPVYTDGVVPSSDFTLTGTGVARLRSVTVPSSAVAASETIILNLTNDIVVGSVVTLSYTKNNTEENRIRDLAGNYLDSISALSVSGDVVVTLDLMSIDDTGSDVTDNITAFDGTSVSFAASLSSGAFRSGDIVKVYRGSETNPLHTETVALSGNGTVTVPITIPTDRFIEGTFDLRASVTSQGREGTKGVLLSITYDATDPTLVAVTVVPSMTNDVTPDYTFSSSEAGTVTYDGSCDSSVSSAVRGSTTITFDELAPGTYSNCSLILTDAAGNVSAPLLIAPFTISTDAPTVTAATYDGDTITLILSKPVYTDDVVPSSDFTLTGTGVARLRSVTVPSSAVAASETIILNLTNDIVVGSVVTLSYTKNNTEENRIRDLAGNYLDSISALSVSGDVVVTLDLMSIDDTGSDVTDNITAFDGTSVSFAASLSSGAFRSGDIVKVYRGSETNPLHTETVALSGNGTVTVPITIPTDRFIEGTFDLRASVTSQGREGTKGVLLSITYDATDPTLVAVTVVPSMTNDVTPDYTFSSSEAGTVTYDGSCDSSVSSAVRGSTTITFDELAPGTYSNCSLILTDAAGNVSAPLLIAPFTISTDAPTVTAATYDGNTITLILSKPVYTDDVVPSSDFTLTGTGVARLRSVTVPSSAVAASETIILNLTNDIVVGSVVTLSYTKNNTEENRIRDLAGNYLDSISALSVSGDVVVTLDLMSIDDTGSDVTDNITAFDGTSVSFAASLSSGAFRSGDIVKVYRGSETNPLHTETVALSGNGTVTVPITIPTDRFIEGTFDLRASVTSQGREGTKGVLLSITYDATDPTLVAVTVVPSMTNDVTPDYTFSSSEAGTVTYDGSCDSSVSSAVRGSTTITFDELAPGTYSNCSLILTDAAGNVSAPLLIAPFTISTDAPTVTAATYDGDTITLILSKPVYTDGVVPSSDFTLTGTGVARLRFAAVPSSAVAASETIILNLTNDIVVGSVVTLSYTKNNTEENRIRDLAGNYLDSISALSVSGDVVVTFDLMSIDDTGSDVTDNITAFDGTSVSFAASLSSGAFRSGDIVKVYRGSETNPLHTETVALSGNGTVTVPITIPTDRFIEGTFDLRASVTSQGRESWKGSVLTITYDETKPSLVQEVVVLPLTNDVTPDYTFSSSEAGTITYDGDCGSAQINAVFGSNTVTFRNLATGTYTNCTIMVTDVSGNESDLLTIRPFTVDPVAPVIDSVSYNSDTITIVVSEPVYTSGQIFPDDFTLTGAGDARVSSVRVASSVSAASDVIVLSLSSPITLGSSVLLTYIQSVTEANRIIDRAGNLLESVASLPVSGESIILDLDADDDTGMSLEDNKTTLGTDDSVSFTATLGSGVFKTGDSIVVYRDAEINALHVQIITSTDGNGQNSVSFTIPKSRFNEGTFGLSARHISGPRSTVPGPVLSITYDLTIPVFSEVVPVPTPTNDITPDLVFSLSESATITYDGDCDSVQTEAVKGVNTITFDEMEAGEYDNCTLLFTDPAGNESDVLEVEMFSIDVKVPTIVSVGYNDAAVILTMSEPVYSSGTVSIDDFTFKGVGNASLRSVTIGSSVETASDVVTLVMSSFIEPGSTVSFSYIPNSDKMNRITDTAGNELAEVSDQPVPEGLFVAFSRTQLVNMSIPDNSDAQDTISVITVPNENFVKSVSVAVDIRHTYRGDLKVDLVAPDGTVTVLHNRGGGAEDNLIVTYTSALDGLRGVNAHGDWQLRVGDYTGQDIGVFRSWTLKVNDKTDDGQTEPIPSLPWSAVRQPGMTIPDNTDTQGTTSTITVPSDNTVNSIAVDVNIIHSYRGDLKVDLVAPDGTVTVLHNRGGGNAGNLVKTYTTELDDLRGINARGDWTLRVGDYSVLNFGVFRSWTLKLNDGTPVSVSCTAPSAPSVSVTEGDRELTATWTVASGHTYQIRRNYRTGSASSWTNWRTGTNGTHTFSGLTNDREYTVELRRKDTDCGDSHYSSAGSVAGTPRTRVGGTCTAPSAPSVSVTEGDRELTATWTVASGHTYQIRRNYRTGSASSWTNWRTGTNGTHTFSGLTNDREYTVELRRKDTDCGDSHYSSAGSVAGTPRTRVGGTCTAPSAPSVSVTEGDRELTATWTVASGHTYQIRRNYRTGSASSWTNWRTGTNGTHTFSGLTNDREYTVELRRKDTDCGDSHYSSAGSVAGTPRTRVIPWSKTKTLNALIPDNTDTQGTTSTITVPSDNTVNSIAVDVNIIHSYRGDLKVDLVAPDGTVTVLHNRGGGNAGNLVKTYTTELDDLRGINARGDWTLRVGDYSVLNFGVFRSWTLKLNDGTPVSVSCTAPSAPSVSVTEGDRELTATWTVASGHTYQIRRNYRTGSASSWTNWRTGTNGTHTFSGLTNDREYTVELRRKDTDCGDSHYSSAGSVAGTPRTRVGGTCTAPSAPSVSVTEGDRELTATWTVASGHTYQIRRNYRTGSASSWTNWRTGTNGTHTFSGLTNDREYTVELRRKDTDCGDSHYSSAGSVAGTPRTRVGGTCTAPSAPSVSVTEGDRELTATWTVASGHTYQIRRNYRTGSASSWTNWRTGTNGTHTFSGLTNDREYTVELRRKDTDCGDSHYSSAGSVAGTPRTRVIPWSKTKTLNALIPDNTDTQGTTSTITVPSDNTVNSIAVDVNIIHSYRGDLKVDLVAPDGTVTVLHNRGGGNAGNLVKTYTTELDDLRGINARGDWTLRVGDYSVLNFGVFRSWTLKLND